jgi:hypothetical protein
MTGDETQDDAALRKEEHRILVFGPVPNLPENWSAIACNGHERPHASDESFDAVLVTQPTQASVLLGWLHNGPSPIAPVIDLSGGNLPFADVQAPLLTHDTLSAGLVRATEISNELDALSPIPMNQDRDGLAILGLAYSRGIGFVPVLDAGQKDLYFYPLLVGIADACGWLEALAASDLLTRHFHDRVYVCERCQSARLSVREVCAVCKSPHISEDTLVHHYRCGMEGPRTAFLHGETLVCPKCNGQLRHFGVDYDTPGQVIHCEACGGTEAEPEISFLCIDCREVTPGAAAQRRDWHSFSLTEAGEVAAVEGRLPGTRLQTLEEGLNGWRSPHEMAMLLHLCMGLEARYQRPFTVVTLTLSDPAAITARSGRTGLVRLHRLLVDLVVETVGSTDGVAILGDRIIICFPETPPDHVPLIVKRLQERFSGTVADSNSIEVRFVPVNEVAELASDLGKT